MADSGFAPDVISATLSKRHDLSREAFSRAALLSQDQQP